MFFLSSRPLHASTIGGVTFVRRMIHSRVIELVWCDPRGRPRIGCPLVPRRTLRRLTSSPSHQLREEDVPPSDTAQRVLPTVTTPCARGTWRLYLGHSRTA